MKYVLVVALVACGAPSHRDLPGASITPHLRGRPATPACGYDVLHPGSESAIARYRFRYNDAGRLIHTQGSQTDGGPDDTIDYQYDNIGHRTHVFENRSNEMTKTEVTENYNTLGDLLDYTWEQTSPQLHMLEHYAYSEFTPSGQPTREVVSSLDRPDVHYRLDYDAMGRIQQEVADTGSTTTYTYGDADSRTVTIDTDHGRFTEVISYDDRGRELSDTSDGSDPSVIATAYVYAWGKDRMINANLMSGSTAAPHDLVTYEIENYLYNCIN